MKEEQNFKKMIKQINDVGGQLTFDFKIDDEGWIIKCRQIKGIITGGKSKKPSEKKVVNQLVDAIKTAFHINK